MADTDRTLAAQKAIIARLRAHAGVAALVGARVYDEAPDDVAFPYVALGSFYAAPALETRGGEGWEAQITLDVWSRAPGRVEAQRIMAAMVDALNNATPALDAGLVVMMRIADQRTLRDPDGRTTHGVVRVQVFID